MRRLASAPVRRLALAAAVLAAGAVGLYIWTRPARDGSTAALPTTPAALAADIADGRPGALERARALVAGNPAAHAAALRRLLIHEHWRVRAAACELLGEAAGGGAAEALVPRASDTDWRVRAAAMEALAALAAADPPPLLRDAGLDRRERWILAWLEARDRSRPPPLAADLCDLYAGAGPVEFGPVLAGRCLACHAGTAPAPPAAGDACARCHEAVHAAHGRSAHAQSLTHLHLMTVDPSTRQPARMDFGAVRGIGCAECHATTGPPPVAGVTAAGAGADGPDARGRACPYPHDAARPPRDACARCHAATHGEWEAWRQGPQPRRAVWPPGQLDLDARGDPRHCVDCHMPRPGEGDDDAPRRHDWSARRSVRLLRDGLDVRVERARDEAGRSGVRLVLTNLAGHAWPTGTRRRALGLAAGPAGEALPEVARLVPVRPGGTPGDGEPALRPGEQRAIFLPTGEDARAVACRATYYRDAADPRAHTVEVFSGTLGAEGWPSP